MLKLAYVVLAHEPARFVADQVKLLLEADPTGHVVVHYDARVARREFTLLETELASCPRALLVSDRLKCDWGKFSLVDAVIRALRLIRDRQVDADYVYLLSSTCVPIKPIAKLKRFLQKSNGMEFIEAFSSSWVRNGLREDRYTKYHWFSWRTHRKLFDTSVFLQRLLRINRRAPQGLSIRFGSQWWCLTRETCFGILDLIAKRPGAYRFFRSTWIPDEIFFATAAAAIAGEASIAQKHLTYFMFTPKGRPISFYDDHLELVKELPFFFARKVSLTAHKLRQTLRSVASAEDDLGEMPQLDSVSANFKYDHHLSRSVDFARPGQIFYGGQSFSGWPSSLGSYPGVFGVLHGPPDITRAIGRRLEKELDATLLGRVFDPEKVDLCAKGEQFAGFSMSDNKIRDLDRALYLSRLLQRAKGLPLIEMAPGDESYAEWYFHQSKNVVFIPCIPANPADEDLCRLYWLLSAAGFPSQGAIRPYEMRATESFAAVRPIIDGYIARVIRPSHQRWVNEEIVLAGRSRRILPIRWAIQNRLRLPIDRKLGEELHNEFGPVVLPLIRVLPTIEFDFRNGIGREVLDRFPPSWARLFERYFVDRENLSSGQFLRDSAGPANAVLASAADKIAEIGP
jgi:Core-2/I-Branching enzyme